MKFKQEEITSTKIKSSTGKSWFKFALDNRKIFFQVLWKNAFNQTDKKLDQITKPIDTKLNFAEKKEGIDDFYITYFTRSCY